MVSRKLKRRTVPKRQTVVSVIIGVITLILIYALVAVSITPVKYDLVVGQEAPATITANKDIEDTISTQAAKDAAKEAVSPMYTVDEQITTSVKQDIANAFDNMIAATKVLKDAYITDKLKAAGYGATKDMFESSYDPSDIDWQSVMTDEQIEMIRSKLGIEDIPDAVIHALAALDEAKIMKLKEEVRDIVAVSMSSGVQQDHLQTEKDRIERDIEGLHEDRDLTELAFLPVDRYMQANMLYDETTTNQARQAAADKVLPVIYKESQTVVVAGETVNTAQMKVLQDLGVVGGENIDYMRYIGIFLFLLLLFGVYAVYLYQFESIILTETRKLIILAVITVVVVGIAVPLVRLDTQNVNVFFGTMMVLFGTMLATVLVAQKTALALNVILAFVMGVVCSWNTGLFSNTMLKAIMLALVGGWVSVFALYRPGHRAALIFAGLAAGGVNTVLAILLNLIGSNNTDVLLLDGVYALGSGLFAGVLAIGTLPIWEAVFQVSTPTKLLELSNPNHPLLKRLTLEAPGTYHHSILTANLAEAGADAIGANALLCRVGAYYHDVGKLKGPKMFKENQKGENPHDKLDPLESAKIITGHLTHGLELAHKYKLPRDVQKVMVQHHGDSTVAYFLHKAKEEGQKVDEAQYRYQGSKPSTKESAIVMLADTVEAAVRSMDDPDKEQVREMINKLIRSKYNDGQLDECPLNRRDLNTLAKAFLGAFDGAFHERVKYPGQE